MRLSNIAGQLVPPIVTRWWRTRAREAQDQQRFCEFYGKFLSSGDLCFDIGANLGNRVSSFRSLGCRVVALEPQSKCLAMLRKKFGADSDVTLIAKAVGSSPGQATLRVASTHVLSSLSDSFISATRGSGRFAEVTWSGTEQVEVTTLDVLIAEFGTPRFVKIDVEGAEPEVIAGLSSPVPALSFEWVPELYEHSARCIRRLMEIGDYEFNLSWGESMRFSRPEWRSAESILLVLEEFRGESLQFGDVYARLRTGDGTRPA